MNWPKFMSDYRLVSAWLEDNGCKNAAATIIALISSILRGCDEPEQMVRDSFPGYLSGELPSDVQNVLSRWYHCLPRTSTLLGEIHERTSRGRKAHGVYYTPPEVVDFILSHTLAHYDILKNPKVKILDPACGCGYFLLKAYDILQEKFQEARSLLVDAYPEADWSDDGIHRHILQHNLWGADIDPVAVDIAVSGLQLKRPQFQFGAAPNILVCDSLKSIDELRLASDKNFWLSKYDFVVGNPPYLSFGLRGQGSLDPEYAVYLRNVFKESAEYKLSYYVLFMQRGIEMLANGGKLGFIVPDSFLLGRYFSKIRRFILENTSIDILAHITTPVFKHANVGMSTICIFTREEDAAIRDCRTMDIYQSYSVANLPQSLPACCYEQNYFASLPHNRFRLFFDLTAKRLIDKIERISLPLVKFASGHTGVRSLTRQANIISDSPLSDTWRPGLISGQQVSRYDVEYQGHWLNIDPEKLHKGGWRTEIVSQRKILMRQTGFSLTAAIDEHGYYHLNNIHSFVLCDQAITADYLVLLLNSRLMSFYYHVTSMEFGRAMAQTDIETIELLPVKVHPDINRQAPDLIKAMTGFIKRRRHGDREAEYKAAALDEYFNQLVFRIYDLTDAEHMYIVEYERNLSLHKKHLREKG